jgi:hypothetical protein
MLRDGQAVFASFHGIRGRSSQEREGMKSCRCQQ